MKLLQDLLHLNEGRMKDAIIDVVERAINDIPATDNIKDDLAKIVARIKKIDNHDLTAGMSDEDLMDMIKPMIGESLAEGEEDSVEQDEVEPKILSTAAGANGVKYMVVLDPTSEQVQVVDNTHKVYLQVPLVIWQQLARSQG